MARLRTAGRAAALSAAVAGLLTATFATPSSADGDDELPEQWRSYWVDAFNPGIYNADQVEKLVDDALAVNANALIVQTARRYDCFCNRALYPRTDAAIAPEPYDPLDEIIEQAHAAGLEVHAWVNVNTMWNSTTPPTSDEHVFNQHGPTAEGEDRWLNKMADGTELRGANAYIDPGHPDAVDYIVDAVQSIVAEYDVDGINLDYVRYPDFSSSTTHSDWGYNDVSVARFQDETGHTDVPEASDEQWSDWRRDQMTNLVRKIYLGMWEVDPAARLTMDAITYGFGPQSVGGWENTRTYAEVLQDWRGWQDEGIMDTVVAMNYKREWMPDQARMFEEWNEVLADWQGDRQSVSGPALYLNEIEDSLQQVQDLLTPTDAGNTVVGWSGYSYANPSMTAAGSSDPAVKDAERAALAEALTEGDNAPFAEPAAVPSMPWKENPTDGHVSGELVTKGGEPLNGVKVTLQPLTGGGEKLTRSSDGSGWFGFAHVPSGRYLVRIELPDGVVGKPVTYVQVTDGEIATAELAPLVRLR
ncbi:family 10 glycosylhydrolase [Phytoactinopolyspora halotolerans]|uniref:Family 10 glycosylhydrolase n=1 Tax=Phytoactinopolyspora halotolerans TaxID=1981512 RepID=A0A6L9S176_9ACTN|nr:family 10 glycosylhydrolase [Phytoactinopolyspora halotolerans]NED98925.1 family 10 glycosylhydrolase [Phytoactinopolyspora halotolerans]